MMFLRNDFFINWFMHLVMNDPRRDRISEFQKKIIDPLKNEEWFSIQMQKMVNRSP